MSHLAHVASTRTLIGTFVALIALTAFTVAGGDSHLVIALAIAGVKATLVALNFMHLRYDRAFHTVVFVAALLAIILFFGLVLIDTDAYSDQVIWEPAPAAGDM